MRINNQKDAEKVIRIGLTANKVDANLSRVICADVLKSDKNGQSTFTKTFDKMFNNGTPEDRKELADFMRTKVQTLIKAPATQKEILGDGHKVSKVTMKKVNLPMCDNDSDFFNMKGEQLVFNESDHKSVRIVIERKPKPEEKVFTEELVKLLDKFDENTQTLIDFCSMQGTAETFKDEIIQAFKDRGLTVEIKIKK